MKIHRLLLVLFLPVMVFSQPIGFDIPEKPNYVLPAGYEWYLQQTTEGELRWIPLESALEPDFVQPSRPNDKLPRGWDWFPVYREDLLIHWKAQPVPSWFERNRTAVEYIGGFILAVLNVFSFSLGRKLGAR